MTMPPEMTVSEYLHGQILESDTLEAFLNALTRLAALELSESGTEVLCGVTLLRHKKAGTIASSSATAQAMDELQYDYRDGPCLTAARTQQLVHAPDLATDVRWPDYSTVTRGHGIHSVLAIPFDLEGPDRAALNIYAGQPHWFTPERVAAARAYADQTAQALQISIRLAHHHDAEHDALEAMKSRTSIDLAVGIIMGQNRCSQDDAFALLVSASNTRNIKLRDVATSMVEGIGIEEPATHFDR
ncbi:GAF and ANTAR domain-containing protein [Micrococcaceae bacterium RIT802]|nr:GAF and ANTAR domain-containing protein [Micrococcaceae bacterium RIT 802]